MPWPLAMLTLVLVLVLSTWNMLAVMAVRGTSLIVHGVLLSAVTAMAIEKMLEWDVKVCMVCMKWVAFFWSGSVLNIDRLQLMQVATVHMVTFVWWEAPISMRVEWRCASMTSGGQCVMTAGTTLMQLWSASNWDMHTLEASVLYTISASMPIIIFCTCPCV